ncbi:uncharacterized protein LOC135057228, partial [Pseudophryne corroboree]|uniref:uncharacterized protein LOC135057228 n=1 Tax=Pseudophryne corroboree TaxID=495146 RepID=UPI0030820D6F
FHLDLLLKTFESNPYPGISLREKLSHLTGVHESRIQVWFQNRRARKNKMKEPEEENSPEHMEWRQCVQLPQLSETQHKREVYQIGHAEKHGHIHNNYAFPFHLLSHLHMSGVVGSQNHNYGWPKHCQATTKVVSEDPTARHYYPHMQHGSSSHLQQPTFCSDYSTDSTVFANSPGPVVGVTQELSLQDILEEFQPCCADVANTFSDLTSDLVYVQVTGSRSISGKVRRRRTVFSRFHLDLLLKTFESNPYPGISLREKLSHLTGVHESRIQVWFQNRRARKNKKKEPEEENSPEHMEWRQCVQLPQLSETQHKREVYQIGHAEKHGHIHNNYAFPFHPLSHLHMSGVVGPQNHNYGWPKHCQATTKVVSVDPTARHYYPHMQHGSSSHLQQPTFCSDYSTDSTDFANSPRPVVGVTQELSLQDILEEFQPCWADVANTFSDLTSDLG